jgi:hypothetical protein
MTGLRLWGVPLRTVPLFKEFTFYRKTQAHKKRYAGDGFGDVTGKDRAIIRISPTISHAVKCSGIQDQIAVRSPSIIDSARKLVQ